MNRKNIIKFTLFISIIFTLCFSIFITNNKVYADENNTNSQSQVTGIKSIFDIKGISGEYKTSSEKEDIYLPFFRNAIGRIQVDKSINNIGILSSSSTIDVNQPLKTIQVLFSSDSIRVNSSMEYAIIWSGSDVVINSNIEKNAIIFSGGTVTIDENSVINDDVIIIAKDVNIKGSIEDSALVSASNLNVSGNIKRDLRCEVSSIDISGNENIKGNVYVRTYNSQINLKDKYPNAIIDVKETKSGVKTFGSILLKAVISCLLFTLLYLIVKKISKGKVYEKMLDKAKNNSIFVILSGAICLLAFPAVFVFLLVISLLGLYILALPVLFVYLTFIIVFVMLSTYVVGSTIFEYMNKNYIKAEKLSVEIVGVFFTFLSLTLLTKIPIIGSYIYIALIMFSVGIMFAYYFKKDKVKDIKK